jgi:hypothetical protein
MTLACSVATLGGQQLNVWAPLGEARLETCGGCSGGLHGGQCSEAKRRA